MPPARKSAHGDPAARAARALERRATALTTTVARSLYSRWRRIPAEQRGKIARIADDVRGRDAARPAAVRQEDVSDVEVRDLRAELASELERLAGADITASQGPGHVAGDAAQADGQT